MVCKHIPLYSSVAVNDSRIKALPKNGPIEVQNISVSEVEVENFPLPDIGHQSNNEMFEDYRKHLNISCFVYSPADQKQSALLDFL